MGQLKGYLDERISELATKLGILESLFYKDDNLWVMTISYAKYKLEQEQHGTITVKTI